MENDVSTDVMHISEGKVEGTDYDTLATTVLDPTAY
jgi:hypothetical protein